MPTEGEKSPQKTTVEEIEDLATALETDTQTVLREDLPPGVRRAAQQHLKESVVPKAEEAVLKHTDTAQKPQ
jgi:hypothetical protein